MEFIDHTGHIFSQTDWTSYPVGYEYEIGNYVFWIESSLTSHTLSTDNYYILPIRFILSSNRVENIKVSIKESDKFRLIGSSYIQKMIESSKGVFDTIDISQESFQTELKNEDLSIIDGVEIEGREGTVSIASFYVVSKSQEDGVWMTDIMIQEDEDVWCPITVGGEFQMESSELIINGQNMGVTLPKDILNSIYEEDLMSDEPDEAELKKKMKELMMNYMTIKGECGNYESASHSLSWFGYGEHMNLRCLLQTDNEYISQYVYDSFDTISDNEWSWKNFRNSSAYAIWIDINHYIEDEDPYRYDEELVGEGKPLTESYIEKRVYDLFDEGDIKFWRPYYKWTLDEMYIKMSMVQYYWKKYFLPLCSTIASASMKQHVWMNDTKYIVKPSVSVCEQPLWIGDYTTYVKFPKETNIYIYNQEAYFDQLYNEFSNTKKIGETTEEEIIYINDICARIPLVFGTMDEDEYETYYDVTFVLTRDDNKIFSSSFNFFQRKSELSYENFILIPKSLVKKSSLSYWINHKYRLSVRCNGNWSYFDFILRVPEFQLKLGTLDYQYYTSEERYEIKEGDPNWIDTSLPEYDVLTPEEKRDMNVYTVMKSMFTQIDSIADDSVNFNSFMFDPKLVETNDINFFDKLKYTIDTASSDDTYVSNNGSTSSGSTMTINNYCDYLASKCYIYGVGFTNDHNRWTKGDSVVPAFRFNNGISLANLEGYKLKSFNVDVLFDVDTNNKWYAKKTFTLDTLNDDNPNIADDVREWSISDKALVVLKNDLRLKGYAEKLDGSIDWDRCSEEWKRFYIDEHVVHKSNSVVRFVTSGEIELPNGRVYSFGGYKADGMPRIYKDLNMLIDVDKDLCSMECDCPFKEECKFRDKVHIYDYDKVEDKAEGEEKKNEIMSDLIKKSMDELISSYSQKIVLSDNKRYLNTVHIYDLYLIKNKKTGKEWSLGMKPSKVKRLAYDKDRFDTVWYSKDEWHQTEDLVSLYRKFFRDDGTCKVELPDTGIFNYDFYLMHDEDCWFVVLISQMTNDCAQSDDDYKMPNEITFDTEDGEMSFVMKKYRSSDRFLMNRMMWTESYPKNHFNQDDLIVATVDNVRFPFILDKTTKWSVKNLSVNLQNKPSIVVNTNSMILSLYDDYNKNASGYYDIDVRYSVDGIVDHQQKKHIRVLIEK